MNDFLLLLLFLLFLPPIVVHLKATRWSKRRDKEGKTSVNFQKTEKSSSFHDFHIFIWELNFSLYSVFFLKKRFALLRINKILKKEVLSNEDWKVEAFYDFAKCRFLSFDVFWINISIFTNNNTHHIIEFKEEKEREREKQSRWSRRKKLQKNVNRFFLFLQNWSNCFCLGLKFQEDEKSPHQNWCLLKREKRVTRGNLEYVYAFHPPKKKVSYHVK